MDKALVRELVDVYGEAYKLAGGSGRRYTLQNRHTHASAIVQAYATMKYTERLQRLVRAEEE